MSLIDSILCAAREGRSATLFALLAERARPEQEELLKTIQKCPQTGDKANALIIAAKNGHRKIVRMLVSDEFPCDVNSVGDVTVSGGFEAEGASALWVAAAQGHFEIIKDLVNAGADVNLTTKIGSTPLRAACFHGHLEMVRFLVKNGADINKANIYNNTCLMIAAYKGHRFIVEFLIDNGADPNQKANCGATALHYASESGHLAIVSALLKAGSHLQNNCQGLTAIMTAADRCQEEILNFILNERRSEIRPEDEILALELIGASFANDKDNYNLFKCYAYLHKAMVLRWADSKKPILKKDLRQVEAYDGVSEAETLEDLLAVQHNDHQLHMQGLTARERILGQENADLIPPIIYRGAVEADHENFVACLRLWLHALSLKQSHPKLVSSIWQDIVRFTWVFCQMRHMQKEIEAEKFIGVIRATEREIKRVKTRTEEMEEVMRIVFYLAVIYSQIAKDYSESHQKEIMQHFFEIVRTKPHTRTGKTLLHFVCDPESTVDTLHTRNLIRVPNAPATCLLLRAGAEVSAMDDNRNTPLHLIVTYKKVVVDFGTLHKIICRLIEATAHADVVNAEGKTPMMMAGSSVAEIILKSQTRFTLKCLAAQSIKKFDLNYEGQVPKELESFIGLHGP